jgi:hypothetical protein
MDGILQRRICTVAKVPEPFGGETD